METEPLESNTTSRPLWPADGGAGRQLGSEVWALGSLTRNCISDTHWSQFPADGRRDVWLPQSVISELALSNSSKTFAIPSCPSEKTGAVGVGSRYRAWRRGHLFVPEASLLFRHARTEPPTRVV